MATRTPARKGRVKVFLKIIGLFLHVANSSPPFLYRQEFYILKERLLGKYGTFLGYELQHIKKICWTCGGTGIYQHNGYDEDCRRCVNGIYVKFWVTLRKYSISKYRFHIPEKKIYGQYRIPVIIEGHIQHKSYGYLSNECFYWLALFFAPKLFVRAIGTTGFPCQKYTPLVILGNTIFNIHIIPVKIKRMSAKIKGYTKSLCLWKKPGSNGFQSEELPF